VGGAAFCLLVAIFCFTLKSQLVKPGRILDAAEDTGMYDKLPRLLWMGVSSGGRLAVLKTLDLSEPEKQELAQEVFERDWVELQLEEMVYQVSDGISSGEGDSVRVTLDLTDVKDPLVAGISGAIQKKADSIPACPGASLPPAGRLCRPRGVDSYTFMAAVRDRVRTVVEEKVPTQYPVMTDEASQALGSLKSTHGALGSVAIVLLLIALGLGGGAFYVLQSELLESPPLGPAGVGLLAGGLLLFVIVTAVKGGISTAVGAAVASLESSTRDVVQEFLTDAVGGGFSVATYVLVIAILAGAGLVYQGFFANR